LAVNEVTHNIFEVTNERLTAASRRILNAILRLRQESPEDMQLI